MKSKRNIWANRRNSFILFIVLAMILVLVLSFIGFFKADVNDEEVEKKPYNSMYNASRYFFRVFYPDDWDVNSDANGFLLNPNDGLVIELYPLQKMLASPSPTAGGSPTAAITPTPTPTSSASATIDPRQGMERNTTLTMSFYYKQYDALYDYIKTLIPPTAAPETPTSEPTPEITPTPSGGPASGSPATPAPTPPMSLEVVADYVFEQFKKDNEAAGYGYSNKKVYQAENVKFIVLPYSYIKDDIKISGELYVAVRAMAYYTIKVEGTETSFNKYNSVIQNILYNMKLSVFNY